MRSPALLLAAALTACAPSTVHAPAPRRMYPARFGGVYLVTDHLGWWTDPFYRLEDDESYPKIVVLSEDRLGCVLTTEDPGYARWATALPHDPFLCPRPWRMARTR